jgi:hypothetical protein
VTVPDCNVYIGNSGIFICSECKTDKNVPSTVSGFPVPQCVKSITNCSSYSLIQGVFRCNSCNGSNYVLVNDISGTPICVLNTIIPSKCKTYESIGSIILCLSCVSGYALSYPSNVCVP